MEIWLQQFTEMSRELIQFSWIPLLIWTLVTGAVMILLRSANRMHVQYHYHIRLALIAGLPLGLLSTWLVEQVSSILISLGAETATLKVLTVMSPLEIGITAAEAASFPTLIDLVFLFSGIAFISGSTVMLSSRVRQWFQLRSLKKQLTLKPISGISGISDHNAILADGSGKTVMIGFVRRNIIPVTFGVTRPVILLPESLKDEAPKLNLAVRHELTHIRNRDFLTHLTMTVIKSVFWFHPLVHMLTNQLVDYREMRCDSLIISDNSVSRKEYASLLFELLPMPNLNRQISVNMAQQSSNLKERIKRITLQEGHHNLPYRSSFTLLGTLLLTLTIAMACTDFQTQAVFDDEELDLMTDVDRSGERGYHQVIIFMGDEGMSERHEDAISKLDELKPEHISEIEVLKGEAAVKAYGDRASEGVILIKTNQDPESYNNTLQVLGMEPDLSAFPEAGDAAEPQDDFFVVVEEMPELIGGLASIQKNITYPEMARRAGIEGRVYVQFIVNEKGDVENPKVIRGIGGGADEEALGAVKEAKFKPGVQRGQPVRVQYSLPVVFRLQNSGTSDDTEAENPEPTGKVMNIDVNISGNQISGKVMDLDTSRSLSGASIVLEGTNVGAVTDMNGEFSLSKENADASQLSIRYVGYNTASVPLNPSSSAN